MANQLELQIKLFLPFLDLQKILLPSFWRTQFQSWQSIRSTCLRQWRLLLPWFYYYFTQLHDVLYFANVKHYISDVIQIFVCLFGFSFVFFSFQITDNKFPLNDVDIFTSQNLVSGTLTRSMLWTTDLLPWTRWLRENTSKSFVRLLFSFGTPFQVATNNSIYMTSTNAIDINM